MLNFPQKPPRFGTPVFRAVHCGRGARILTERAGIPINDRHDVSALFDAFTASMSPSRLLSP